MTAGATRPPAIGARIRRFFRTPKGILIPLLAILAIAAAFGSGFALVAPVVLGGVFGAVIVDAPILRYREAEWTVPDGAILTGLIVAMSPMEPWYVAATTSAIAVLSKYVLRVGAANVFNPAAFALVATFYWFNTGQSWWGALPELSPWALVLLFSIGVFITDRVNKLPLVLAFLGAYYLLVTIAAFVGDPGKVAVLYRSPDLHATLFFAFFMATDPPTSPPKQRDQLVYGAITAVASFAVYELVGAAYFLLAGLLAANCWEAARRHALRRDGRSKMEDAR
jgi:Na+-translocating ferredoxin:NAD+ oxidoreductase RnfD subunit